jgi:Trans-aconitate methyltransferase
MKPGSEDANAGEFDRVAERYDQELQRGLFLSGESKDFFAEHRVEWLRRCLGNERPESILDYGCGTGSTSTLLLRRLRARSVFGVDTSEESLILARRAAAPGVRFGRIDELQPNGAFDLAYCNGVFHHIPADDRPEVVRTIFDAIKPGGWFAFWENNPWSLGARLVMRRIPFDRDAVLLSARGARRTLQAYGFEVLTVHYLFVFPQMLGALRRLEQALVRFPIGAQYQVLCRRPA